MKAIFGGSVKKPLMTKVSMRHLNEIVRERNQYSRDAMEAWQDFINLKGRMDTELTKVTKRNNFLVEELETWKQQVCHCEDFFDCERRPNFVQFLKFQAFAEQLTKETSELKVKIENHKRENRRLTGLIDQQKDDVARLTLRLSGTEKQRDDALEALVLQQEIAEELERERKRNQKELASLQHSNASLARQRDDAQRVVLHLRSLINGQTHHMEHIVRSIGSSAELSGLAEKETFEETKEGEVETPREPASSRSFATEPVKAPSSEPSSDLEQHLLNIGKGHNRLARLSITDVADRYLRDKTDAISDIIRSISEQCAAAVEGLQLAQDAEEDDIDDHGRTTPSGNRLMPRTHDGLLTPAGSEMGDGDNNSLHPNDRHSSVPPTPDLVHNRSSTSMSMISSSTFPERSSQQYGVSEIPTRIVEDNDERAHETAGFDEHSEPGTLSKQASEDLMQSSTSRLVV